MKKRAVLLLIPVIILIQVVGSMWFDKSWYNSLQTPHWTPSDEVFAPVWSILYVMIAFAGIRLIQKKSSPSSLKAWCFYIVQLLINGSWSFLFFGLQSPLIGLLTLGALLLTLSITLIYTYQVDIIGFYLLVPYFVWVAFVFCLNYKIWVMNG
jgi:tryptophan-rich sensory protein